MNFITSGIYTAIFSVISLSIFAQTTSIREEQLDYYNSLGNADANFYEQNTSAAAMPLKEKSVCNLDKTVYGWHPYWVGSAYNNYDWDLLSHFSFFSYEVDAATGNANTTHGWATSTAVDAALASGNTKVTLTATLFSGHSTFFGSSTAQQTLIDNLISLVQSRGAHGVNIDFEGLPSSQKTNFANWMVSLANQMHAAIPGSEVSTVLYAVDWSNVFDFSIMEPEVDQYIVMGYAYYYQGSSTAGPCDPLYHFGSSYNYTLSKTTSYYIDQGCPKEKFILGLPYYGYEWPTSSLSVPSSTTGTGSAKTYSVVKNNTSGNYSTGNHIWETDSYTDIFAFTSGGQNKQCFITLEDGFNKRLEFVEQTDIGGIGIWALGYDDGYSELWDAIETHLTDCQADECSGTIHDFGGPTKNYYNDEDYTWTIDPPGTTALTFNFTQFDVEANFDYLYIYDGADVNAAQISGSPFTGTNSPGSFTSSTGAVTFRWTSDGATVAPGFIADWTCNADITPPTTSVSHPNNWETQDFTATYTDNDNNAIAHSFHNVSDFDGSDWGANANLGFFNDEFAQSTISSAWTTSVGTWTLVNGSLEQTDENETNTNLNATLIQNDQKVYLYHWTGQINGTGTNRRAGIHFFCDDATSTQRGNSYMVYWRVDSDKCQIYKSDGTNIPLMTNDDVVVDPNTTYDFKILYDPSTGLIQAYLDDELSSEWTDPSPLTSADGISLRTGNCIGVYDDFRVYQSRSTTETISVSSLADQLRYQNPDPSTPAGNIRSILLDQANNWSTVASDLVNVDWTEPTSVTVNDGLSSDIDIFNINTEISGNWTVSTDPNSNVAYYEYAVGTTQGGTNIINWTNNGTSTSFTATGLSLTYGTTYFVSVKTTNGAGLTSIATDSDGQLLENPTQPPVAGFSPNSTTICQGDSIQLINNSQNATSYLWSIAGGIISNNTANNPYVTFTTSGTYNVTLVASGPGGTDQNSQNITITVTPGPDALAMASSDTIYLPSAIVSFTNNSTNATSYEWDFGDGNTSTDENPWNSYGATGVYDVSLIAMTSGCSNDTAHFEITVLDNSAGISTNYFEAIRLYPNPFNDHLTISGLSSLGSSINIQLFDMSGRIICSQNISNHTDIVILDELNVLSKGVYQLRIASSEKERSYKIVK
ncbi:MAG: T9SS type A sorting domain-containing protein [Flavobacteriales bacterium]|nr:T9SS type A sorting domain-containing protein [Flavobacteriales bacterium]